MSTDPTPPQIDTSPAWKALQRHAETLQQTTLNQLFAANPQRGSQFSARSSNIYFDYSKDHLTEQTLALLFDLADTANLTTAINDLFDGKPVNNTENRPALHTALRNGGQGKSGVDQEASSVLKQVCEFAEQVRQGTIRGSTGKPFENIVNLGIGGSDLGPRLVIEAFPELHLPSIHSHFVANIDSDDLSAVLPRCSPDTTLFLVSSKSFSTLETLTNANTAKTWLREAGITEQDIARHFVAATGHRAGAVALGISPERIFPVKDWVGGRFSLWSAIGLPIAITLGPEVFKQFLGGAQEMDKHFCETPFARNLPVLHGLQTIWHINFRDYKSRAVLPYVHKLRRLPDYLQQLVMESLGKSTTKEGLNIPYPTGQVIWGSEGTNGQHSFHQLLLQGTETTPIDFITTRTAHCEASSHQQLLSNCLAQSKALMQGKSIAQAHEELITKGASESQAQLLARHHAVPGNRPSNTLLLDELKPHSLGSLLAFYEHSVYVQSVIWNINAFDQWGVELGKEMGTELFSLLNAPESDSARHNQLDSSTSALLAYLHNSRPPR